MTEHPFIESQNSLKQPEVLRQRLEANGYLFFRNLLDHEPLLRVRRQMLEICQKHGWLLNGSNILEGRGRADAYSGYFEFTPVYREIQLLEDFHALPHHPKIVNTLAAVLGGTIFPHPRNISRITLPGSLKMTTPPHQDYVFIQGTRRVYTVWFPLSDCPRPLGGLGIAAGSHRLGVLPTKNAEGTGGLCTDVDETTLEWHAGDFHLGDVIIFPALTLHKAYHNTTKETLRLSCDFRYQLANEPLVWDTIRPHMQLHSWETIYANWKADTYKYYWLNYSLQVVPGVHPAQVPPDVQ
jgi:ectoine hydroxylase-related dioxygenase (phytanoyl-CoA dioxygenase family)